MAAISLNRIRKNRNKEEREKKNRDTEKQRYRRIEIQKNRDTEEQRYRRTEIQKNRDKKKNRDEMIMDNYMRVYAEIDLDAVAYNMESMKKNLAPGAGMIGVVKTDGYGHGAVPVAKTIAPYVEGYAVATIDEARILQRHGIAKPILILGVTHPSRYGELVEYEIRPAIFTMEQAEALSAEAVSRGKTARIHLAVDTGMSRIGMRPDEASADLAVAISRLPGICVEGMFTHFARADETDKASAREQMKKYMDFTEMLRKRGLEIPVKHISNSAGIIDLKEAHLDMARAGISIYGIYPSDEVDKERVPLKPVMSLRSYITYVKEIRPGEAVSYGGTYVADRPVKVATIPVGYGDGYPRNLSGKGRVLIGGKSAPILGRVCMDQFMVDVTDIPEADVWTEVTLLGESRPAADRITVDEIAATGGGFTYEIVCDIGKRVPRVYLRGGRVVGTKDYFDDVYRDFLD